MRSATIMCAASSAQLGLLDHTRLLGCELVRRGVDVSLITRAPLSVDAPIPTQIVSRWDAVGVNSLVRAAVAHQPDVVLLQYVPNMFHRRGITIVPALLTWSLKASGISVVPVIHEAYMPLAEHASWVVQGLAQRLMLLVMIACCQAVVVTTRAIAAAVRPWLGWPAKRVTAIAVGSNLPAMPLTAVERAQMRQRLGLAADELMLVFFGSLHPSKLFGWVLSAAAAVQDRPVRLVAVGPTAAEVSQYRTDARTSVVADRTFALGLRPADEAARILAAADLALLPFVDGATNHRGSLMAVLSNAVPVVSTIGPDTDPELAEAGLALTRINDQPAFTAKVRYLVANEAERCRLAAAGKRLYEREYAWPVIAGQLLTWLGATLPATLPAGVAGGL